MRYLLELLSQVTWTKAQQTFWEQIGEGVIPAGGSAGNLKMTMPTAFTTAMLAWGLLSFGSGYSQEPGLSLKVEQQVVWGADYLLKTVSPNGQGFDLIYQVRSFDDIMRKLEKRSPVSPSCLKQALHKVSRY